MSKRLAFMASGSGTNFENIVKEIRAGHLQAEAAILSGRAFLLQAAQQIWDEATSTESPTLSLESRTTLRLASTHAIRLAAQIVESLYTACGATVVFDGHLIQRLFQDMHVITQHGQGRLAHYEVVGQHRLGLNIDDARL